MTGETARGRSWARTKEGQLLLGEWNSDAIRMSSGA